MAEAFSFCSRRLTSRSLASSVSFASRLSRSVAVRLASSASFSCESASSAACFSCAAACSACACSVRRAISACASSFERRNFSASSPRPARSASISARSAARSSRLRRALSRSACSAASADLCSVIFCDRSPLRVSSSDCPASFSPASARSACTSRSQRSIVSCALCARVRSAAVRAVIVSASARRLPQLASRLSVSTS